MLTALALLPALAGPLDPPGLRIDRITPTAYEAALRVDPGEPRFSGTAKISLTLEGKHKVIWLNALDIEVSEATMTAGGKTVPLTVVEGDAHHLGFRPKKPAKGDVVLDLTYTGGIRDEATEGAFAQEEGGRHYVLTQFEATDARRVFPSVDDPRHKLPWTLTLDVPEGLGAYANTPAVDEQVAEGRKVVHFATSKPMPSYLVAFAVGPFDEVDAGTAGREDVPVRILVPEGRAEHAAWAAEATGPVLETLEDYFDRPYPYEKLDVITIPQAVQFGAMENPGLITFTQSLVIARPEDDTEGRRRSFAQVQAHELGHQWFGNLVTPEWWDDIWLNESFASWIEHRATDTRWPEWNVGAGRVSSRNGALNLDARESSRQIREPIVEFDDIDAAFDGITYSKGQAVLEMAEAWLGTEVFRSGVKLYMERHAWGNATADDFLDALSTAANQDVSTTLRTFLDQPGAPVVSMAVSCEGSPDLSLSQQRLLSSGEADASLWQVPVCVRHEGGRECFLLTDREQTFPLSACPETLVPNDAYTGYYRSDLGADATRALLDSEALSSEERLGLIGDTAALIETGRLPPTLLLDQVASLAKSDDPLVVSSAVSVVAGISTRLVSDAQRPTYAAFVREHFAPVAAELGWEPVEGEAEEVVDLRRNVLGLLGSEGEDPEVIAEAQRRATQWLETRDGTDATLVGTALGLAAENGDKALFDTLSQQALAEEDRKRRGMLLDAIGAFEDPAIVPDVLILAGDESLGIRERAPLLFSPLMRPSTQAMGWSYVTENIDAIEKSVPGLARAYIVYLAGGFCSEDGARTTEDFFAERAKKYLTGKRALATVTEQIRLCEGNVARQAPAVEAFLTAEAERQAAVPAEAPPSEDAPSDAAPAEALDPVE
ncbi:MAG: M1 family peptidase [Deltaproteobacteria bacterium]|nr:MAG: M1 family peptidase [Deltaproteobacteria bacterium]